MRKAKRPVSRSHFADKMALGLFILMAVGCYLRLFISVGLMGLQDEYHWVGSAALSSLGGVPFVNDLNIQQLCGLVYEPLVWLYYKLFGGTGVLLFVRHLYFGLAATAAFLLYKFYRAKTDQSLALAIASLPLVTAFWGQPSLGYNAIGGLGFIIGSLLILQGLDSRRNGPLVIGSVSYFFVLAAYPTLVGAVAVLWFTTLLARHRLQKTVVREFLIGSGITALLLLLFVGSLIARAGWEQLELAYRFSTSQSSLGSFTQKFLYGLKLWIQFLPPWYVLLPGYAVWIFSWYRKGASWLYFAVPIAVWIAIQEPPEPGPYYPTTYLILALSGLPLILGSLRKNFKDQWPQIIIWSTCLIATLFPWWSSALTLYVTFITSTYCLPPLLTLDRSKNRSPWLSLVAFVIPLTVFAQKVVLGQLDDQSTDVEWLSEGPYAGLITSSERAGFLRDLTADIDRAKEGAKSIFFYDEFPLGYLMAGMKPATPTLFTHGLRESSAVRPYYLKYYSLPSNRPDVIVRFNYFSLNGNRISVHPDQYEPYTDVFWRFPEESGAYALMVEREQYSIFRKSPAP